VSRLRIVANQVPSSAAIARLSRPDVGALAKARHATPLSTRRTVVARLYDRGADEEQVDLMLMSERIAVCEQFSRVSPSLSLHQAMCMVEHGRKQTAKIRLDALGASGQVFEPA